ncbi:Sulfotransferase domain-containing protein [Parasphingorhabdus marina DSM 22363]|uniref:Sulfotransferase domain-containing protein n=1 Tax=Parasphingorhabdus marina DSM 22363 TaxID=1123272 RepID=A0A1N6H0A1_9SPHN|nr:sulfotransferase domain-containing protein [Parasphingorhabdus marina]SIO13223.1 Sulfotransferase domain-containing protein [Parasphingorhabdus marina DSM 22363]
MKTDKGRARSLEELGPLMARIFTPPEDPALKPPRPQSGDVMISPYGKSGTTMMQQMFHQLRTGGDMDFDDISRVVPWIETAPVLGLDINADQRAKPRGFKSHLHYGAAPSGMRYVIPLRAAGPVFLSAFHFFEGWFLEPGSVSLEEFYGFWSRLRGPVDADYWDHLLSWWDRRDEPDTLLLSYDHVVAEKRLVIRKFSSFCGISCDDALLDLVEERTSRSWMLAHKDRFDDAMMRKVSEERGGLPPGSDSAKIRSSDAPRRSLPPEIASRLDAEWRKRITPVTGHADFAALEADLVRSLTRET